VFAREKTWADEDGDDRTSVESEASPQIAPMSDESEIYSSGLRLITMSTP